MSSKCLATATSKFGIRQFRKGSLSSIQVSFLMPQSCFAIGRIANWRDEASPCSTALRVTRHQDCLRRCHRSTHTSVSMISVQTRKPLGRGNEQARRQESPVVTDKQNSQLPRSYLLTPYYHFGRRRDTGSVMHGRHHFFASESLTTGFVRFIELTQHSHYPKSLETGIIPKS